MIYGHKLQLGKAIVDALGGFAIGRTGLTMPTMALWRINRYANNIWGRHSKMKHVIYGLKNVYVRMLYEQGYCARVVLETQKIRCWHTGAYNEGWDDCCPKCGNTDIYAQHELYHFTFNVDGCWYSWHQPVRLVDFPVKLDFGHTEFWGHIQAPYDEAEGHNVLHDVWTVWWCLLLSGYRAPLPLKLYEEFRRLGRFDRWWWYLRRFIEITDFRMGIQRCPGCGMVDCVFGHYRRCECEIPF